MSAPGKLRAAAWTGLLGLLLATLGCSDSNEPGDGGGGDLVSQQIGPEGGTVRSSDGQLTLIFPAGAVSQAQNITIETIEVSETGSEFSGFTATRAYRLGPDGLNFSQPVTASIPSNQQIEQTDGSLRGSVGLFLTSTAGTAVSLDSLRIEEVDGGLALRGDLNHFSPLVYVEGAITITITGVPVSAPVGSEFPARISVSAEIIEITAAFSHSNETDGAITALDFSVELAPIAANEWEGSFRYKCERVGQGGFSNEISVYFQVNADAPNEPELAAMQFGRSVTCEEEAPVGPLLSVSKSGSGTGTVVSNPAGINCGDGAEACTENYGTGTAVSLTATPDAGSVFVSWSGACPGGSSVTTVVVDADKTCTAQFDLQVSSSFERYHLRPFSYRLQATAVDPASENTLVTVGADAGGDLDIFDITNPRAPVLTGSRDDFCEGALSVFFADPPVETNPTFIATSTTDLKGCVNNVPPGPGTVWNYNFAPGGGAWIPGTSDYLLADFSGGRVLRRTFMGGTVATIPLGTGQTCPFNVVVSGDLAFVVGEEGFPGTILDCATAANLFIINLATNQLLRTVQVGSTPRRVVVSPDRVRAYVTDFGEDEIYVVNISSGTVETTFVVGDGPVGMAMSASGAFLVVVGWEDGFLHLINPLTGDVLASIDTEQVHPVEVFLTDDDQTAVVTGFGDEEQNQGGSVGLYKVNFNF